MNTYNIYEPSEEEAWFLANFDFSNNLAAVGKWQDAQRVALWWGEGVCNKLRISNTSNWKFFKRNLVAKWFGKPERRRFFAPWDVDEALNYAQSFPGRSVRFSLFPKDIACHAVSYQLSKDKVEDWAAILENADRSIDLEMFPEATTDTSICFRRCASSFGEIITYEAGLGQAMYVFEQERGQHAVVSASKSIEDPHYKFSIFKIETEKATDKIKSSLQNLIDLYDAEISSKFFGVCRKLGIDYLSMEGYYDPARPQSYLIVDFDLPFDIFFMQHDR